MVFNNFGQLFSLRARESVRVFYFFSGGDLGFQHAGADIKTPNTRVVTVDSSAWNLAPWHKPTVLATDPAADGSAVEPGLIAGNTLYENDFFGVDVRGGLETFSFPKCQVGDRLVITASGAYTMTNSRRFNRIPPPDEYAFDGAELTRLTTASFG